MNSKERVLAAIRNGCPDRIPRGEIFIDDSLIISYLNIDKLGFDERWEFVRTFGLDAICLPAKYREKAGKNRLPAIDEVIWEDMDKWAEKTDKFIFAMFDGAFEWGIKYYGFQKFMLMLTRETPEIFDFIKEIEKINIYIAIKACDAGASGVIIADDIAYEKGMLMSPGMFRRLFLPSFEHQINSISDAGLSVFFHSDGNLNEIMDDIVSLGFSGIHCLEPKAGMDIRSIKEKYGKRLCLWGNLDPDYLTLPKTKEEIELAIQRIFEVFSDRRGLIFGSCTGLYSSVRHENLKIVYNYIDSYTFRSP